MSAHSMRLSSPALQVRISDNDELHAVRLAKLYPDVADDEPEAIRWAGRAIKAAQDTANGHTPDIVGANQTLRYRQFQLACEKKLHLVEVFLIATKGTVGRAVALSIVRVLAAFLGHQLTPVDGRPRTGLHEAVRTILRQLGRAVSTSADALADNHLSAEELAAFDKDIDELEARIALYRGARAAGAR